MRSRFISSKAEYPGHFPSGKAICCVAVLDSLEVGSFGDALCMLTASSRLCALEMPWKYQSHKWFRSYPIYARSHTRRPKPSTVLDLVRRAPGLCACAAYLYMGRSCQKLLKDLHFECSGT